MSNFVISVILCLTFAFALLAQGPSRTAPAIDEERKLAIPVPQEMVDVANTSLKNNGILCTITGFEAYYKLGASGMMKSVNADTAVKCDGKKPAVVYMVLTNRFLHHGKKPNYPNMVIGTPDQALRVSTTLSLGDQRTLLKLFLEAVVCDQEMADSDRYIVATWWGDRDNELKWAVTTDVVTKEVFLKY